MKTGWEDAYLALQVLAKSICMYAKIWFLNEA